MMMNISKFSQIYMKAFYFFPDSQNMGGFPVKVMGSRDNFTYMTGAINVWVAHHFVLVKMKGRRKKARKFIQ